MSAKSGLAFAPLPLIFPPSNKECREQAPLHQNIFPLVAFPVEFSRTGAVRGGSEKRLDSEFATIVANSVGFKMVTKVIKGIGISKAHCVGSKHPWAP